MCFETFFSVVDENIQVLVDFVTFIASIFLEVLLSLNVRMLLLAL